LLAEDHHAVRAAVASFLDKEADIAVVGEVGDRADLLSRAKELQPDVLLLDAHMPGQKVISVVQELRQELPAVHILVFSAYDRREYVVGLLRAGASGYVLKDDPADMLLRAVRQVGGGGDFVSPRVAQTLVRYYHEGADRRLSRLTDRERDVLQLIVDGYKNDDIAAQLSVTTQTVKNHVSKIFRKLEVTTRVEAVLLALNEGMTSDQRDGRR
jgi:DNA-binding NarL/FixJ family response regulator